MTFCSDRTVHLPRRSRGWSPRRLALCGLCVPLVLVGCSEEGANRVVALLDASGGDAAEVGSTGGPGGRISIELAMSVADDPGIELRRDGSADTSHTRRTLAPSFGANKLVVDDELVVAFFDEGDPDAGEVYLFERTRQLYVSNGNLIEGDEDPVTGVEILEGGTLVLPHMAENDGFPIRVELSADIVNDGVITTEDLPSEPLKRGDLRIVAASYIGRGDVQNQGLHNGQAGGDVLIDVQLLAVNEGRLLAFGADGADGAVIQMFGDGFDEVFIENTGLLDVHGGDRLGPAGQAGDAGDAILTAEGGVFNTGRIDASGGAGDNGGGDGGRIELAARTRGACINRGGIIADGGDSADGDGGRGGEIQLAAVGARLASSGELVARGGDSRTGAGGAGGAIDVTTSDETASFGGSDPLAPAGPIELSGRLLAHGGAGDDNGGEGGEIMVKLDGTLSDGDGARAVALLGYGAVRVDGGGADAFGADGGVLFVDVASEQGSPQAPIVVEAPIDLSGGDANPDTGLGGDGGDAVFTGGSLDFGDLTIEGGTAATPGTRGAVAI